VQLPFGTRGIGLTLEQSGRRRLLMIELLDRGARDIFEWLCDDVAKVTSAATDQHEAVEVWLGRLARWSRLLQRNPEGLSPERQRGLFAELWFLEQLSMAVGLDEAVAAWCGPSGNPRDFEAHGRAVEVKASAANEPQTVKVSGERQLDDTELEALHLLHLSLEPVRGASPSLVDQVEALRRSTSGRSSEGPFEDALAASGYADVHAPRYAGVGFALRRISAFHVRDAFPRITEQDLRDGVGNVRYGLALEACRDYEVDFDQLKTSFATQRT
jgi:hypothetical protein